VPGAAVDRPATAGLERAEDGGVWAPGVVVAEDVAVDDDVAADGVVDEVVVDEVVVDEVVVDEVVVDDVVDVRVVVVRARVVTGEGVSTYAGRGVGSGRTRMYSTRARTKTAATMAVDARTRISSTRSPAPRGRTPR